MDEKELYEPQEPELKDYLYVALKRKEIVIVFLVVVFLVTLIYSLLMTPIYKSTGVIEIKPEKINIVEDLNGQSYYSTSLDTLLNTQVRILQSKDLAKRVIGKLGLLSKSNEITKKKNTENSDQKKDPGTNETRSLVNSLLGALEVKMIRNTRLIEVSFMTPDPQLSSKLANAWLENFIDMSAHIETLANRGTNVFIAEQINKLQNEIAEKEAKLRGFSQSSEIVIMDEKLNIAMKNLSSLNTSLFDAQTERINKESYFNKVRNSAPDSLPEVFNSPIIQNLETENNKLEREIGEKSKIFKPQWPEMIRLQDQLSKAKQRLKDEKEKVYQNVLESAKAEYSAASQKEKKIQGEFQQQKDEAMKINSDAVTYNALRGEMQNMKNLLDSLLKKKGETSISADMQEQAPQNIRIIEEAEMPTSPVKPKILLNMLLSIVVGLFGGLGLAFFIDYLDDKIKSVDDIEHYIKLPLLGLIPLHTSDGGRHKDGKKKKSSWIANILKQSGLKTSLETAASRDGASYLITHFSPKSLVSEAFRVVRTSVMLTKDSTSSKCIIVTSTQPKEGKTFVSVNLAIALAQVGKKVVLIDCDLRNSRLHKIFKCDNTNGVSGYLVDKKPIQEILIPTPMQNLKIITAGHRAPRPAEFLSLPEFKQMVEELKKEFNFVVIDTPPIVPIADTSIIAPLADMIIMVILNDGTPRKSAMLAVDRLKSVGCPISGCVLNSIDMEGRSYYYYRYYNYSYYYGAPEGHKGQGE